MRIDCQTCPARRIACDGCMMQLLFEPVSSTDGTSDASVAIVRSGVDDRELHIAIDVFSAASMTNTHDAVSAKNAIAPRQSSTGPRPLRIVRAS